MLEKRAGTGLSTARTLNTLERRALVFKKLLVVRRCVPEGIVKVVAMPLRGVHKAVGIFLDIDRVEEQAFVANRLSVFDEHPSSAIDAPHPKACPEKTAVRVRLFQPGDRMETIDRDERPAIKAVISPISDRSAVEQPLPFH
jgi:hypothetical protein